VMVGSEDVCDEHRAQISAVDGVRILTMMSRQQSPGRTLDALRVLARREASSRQTKDRNDAT